MNIALLVLAGVGGAVLTAYWVMGVLFVLCYCILESRCRREEAAMIASGKIDAVQWELFSKGYTTRTRKHRGKPESGD